MKKTKKISLIIISIFLGLTIAILTPVYFMFLHHYKGNYIDNPWYETDTFKIENIATIQKQKDKDFVILNLADIQICDLDSIKAKNTIHKEISYLIEKVKPDLITLTGDQTWSNENLLSLKQIISWLDDYKIPYAPIFGNHDYGNTKNSSTAELNYCCDLYEKGKYSLFHRGPSNLGSLGNYVINIMEDGKIFKTLYMIDSGYEEKISDEQIEWFKWNANGIKNANGGVFTNAMCFIHKPLPEYEDAYFEYLTGGKEIESIGNVYRYYSLSGSSQNGFFDVAKQVGVKDIVCGHQHGNNFTLKYQDVRLTFALKTGQLGGYYNDGTINLNGATSFILNNDVNIINNYVATNEFFITNDENIAL